MYVDRKVELTTLVREHNDNDATTASAANMERAVFIFIFSALLSFCALANGQVFDFSEFYERDYSDTGMKSEADDIRTCFKSHVVLFLG